MLEKTIISWPQSGRTWLITMIGKVFFDYMGVCDLATKFSPYGFGKDIKNLGDYNLHTFPREHEDQAWLKTPQELNTNKSICCDMYGKGNIIPTNQIDCIFLVRNPRDTLVSNYLRKTKIKNPNTNFRGSVSEFIKHEKGSLKTMITWLNLWANNFHKFNSFIIVNYENFHKSTFYQLRQVIDFLGYSSIPDKYIDKAVEFGEIENMRKIEQKEGNENHSMFSKNINFVREGKIGKGWEFFDEEENEYISKYIKMLNSIYGYGD